MDTIMLSKHWICIDLNSKGIDGLTLCKNACNNGHKDVVKLLIDHTDSKNINFIDKDIHGQTLLIANILKLMLQTIMDELWLWKLALMDTQMLTNYCLIVKYLILDWINSEDSIGCNKKDINHDHIQDVVNCQIRVQKTNWFNHVMWIISSTFFS